MLQKRFSHGFRFRAHYTFSKAIDDASDFTQAQRPAGPMTPAQNARSQLNAGEIGNAAKYILRGAGINTWDISLFRNFRVRERVNTQFRCQSYNAFNHTQFSAVNSTARFDAAGAQIKAALGQYTAARRPRHIQLALRVSF